MVCSSVHDMEVAAARPAPSPFGVYLDPIIVVDSLYEEKHEHAEDHGPAMAAVIII